MWHANGPGECSTGRAREGSAHEKIHAIHVDAARYGVVQGVC